MTVRQSFTFPAERRPLGELVTPKLATSAAMKADWTNAHQEIELRGCPICQTVGHCIWWRGYPVLDGGPCPDPVEFDDVVEACFCCFWGSGPVKHDEPVLRRLERDAVGGRDVQVEHRTKAGLWVKFDQRFPAVA